MKKLVLLLLLTVISIGAVGCGREEAVENRSYITTIRGDGTILREEVVIYDSEGNEIEIWVKEQ